MNTTDLQNFIAHHPFGMDFVPRAFQRREEPPMMHYITSSVFDYLDERIFIAEMCERGYTAEEIVPLLREYDRKRMELVLVDIGDDEEETERSENAISPPSGEKLISY